MPIDWILLGAEAGDAASHEVAGWVTGVFTGVLVAHSSGHHI